MEPLQTVKLPQQKVAHEQHLPRYWDSSLTRKLQTMLIGPEEIQKRTMDLRNAILKDYLSLQQQNVETALVSQNNKSSSSQGATEIVALGVLNGAVKFYTDLIYSQNFLHCYHLFVKLTSYDGNKSTNSVRIDLLDPHKVKGKHVLIIEDIWDTGQSYDTLVDALQACEPLSVKGVVLLQKEGTQLPGIKHKPDYIGFKIENLYVVGHGLDGDNGRYRNLPGIWVLKTS